MTFALESELNGELNGTIVVDYQNARHWNLIGVFVRYVGKQTVTAAGSR